MNANDIRHRAKQVLFNRGMRMNLPYRMLRTAAETIDVVADLRDTMHRRKLARELSDRSAWRGFISRKDGYRRLASGEIPSIAVLLEAAQDIAKRTVPLAPAVPKPPSTFTQMMTAEEMQRHPEILDIATEGPLVEAAADYLGFYPRLYYVGLWLSRRMPALSGSQLYHLDQPDTGMLSLFLNVNDVTEDNGPFFFYDARSSARVRAETDYERRSYIDNAVRGEELGRLNDSAVEQLTGTPPIKLTGPAGSAAFVDTSVCMHAGSRCASGERVMFVLRYMPPHRGMFRPDPVLEVPVTWNDRHRLMVLGRA